MDILIRTVYIIASTLVGLYLYHWSSTFKKIGTSTIDEFNEDEELEEEMTNESEAKVLNYFGTITFIILGVIIWTLLGIAIGKIASDITQHRVLKWLVYFFMYFIFLRIPFGIGNKMVKKRYDFDRLPERLIFFLFMMTFYILSICCYDNLPQVLKWHVEYFIS